MLLLRSQGVADLLIVAIKLHAYENTVTYLRIKHAERGRKTKGKGADTLTKGNHMHRLLRLSDQKKNIHIYVYILKSRDSPYETIKR
jgi:hypothetical protein